MIIMRTMMIQLFYCHLVRMIENHNFIYSANGKIEENVTVTGNAPIKSSTIETDYIDENGNRQTVSARIILPGDTQWGDISNTEPQWYVAMGSVELDGPVKAVSDVRLILADGCSLTVNVGIGLSGGSETTFTVYAQSTGDRMGKLSNIPSSVANSDYNTYPGIGGIGTCGSLSLPEDSEAYTLIVFGGFYSSGSAVNCKHTIKDGSNVILVDNSIDQPGTATYYRENVILTDSITLISGVKTVPKHIALPDGTTVSVEGESLTDGLLLMVEEVTEEDGDLYSWLTDCMKGRGSRLRMFDIYFVDDEGNRQELTDQVRVSISLKEDYSEPAVFHVAADGSVKEITGSINGDVISFTALSGGYYVIANHFASAAGIVICLISLKRKSSR